MITADRLTQIRADKVTQLENIRVAFIQVEAQIALLDELLAGQDALNFDELGQALGGQVDGINEVNHE